jgi:hypothetical protein
VALFQQYCCDLLGRVYCISEYTPVEADCNGNGIPDECDIANCPPGDPACGDCNGNGVPDGCDIAGGASEDCNDNGVPDACDIDPTDPDGDGMVSGDCNDNGIPDECVGPALVDGIDPHTEHRVFLTSTSHTGNVGGLAGADAICDARAQPVGLDLDYKAILSGEGVGVALPAAFRSSHTPTHIRPT